MSSLPEPLVRFRTELEDAIRRELEAQASARSNGWGARVLPAVRTRPGRTMLAVAAITAAAAAALFVSSPWKTAPGFLEEVQAKAAVQAALTPPPGRILHVKWDHIFTSEDPACTSTSRHEFWIDTTPPHRYRAIVPLPPGPANADPGRLPCVKVTRAEVGGDLGKPNLRFVPPNRLVVDRPLYFSSVGQDPWAFALEKISEGRAHREGSTTQLDGRTVERVRFDPPTSCPAPAAGHCPTEPEYGYFDPETLSLLAWDYARDPMFPQWRNRERYLAYEYLPRTDDNLALTDIRAQHPDATGP
jgi:hypothetical protein